jgi:hypothetical protein
MPPLIVRPKERSEDPNDYSRCNSTPWHPELTVLNLVVDPLKTETIYIKGHEYHSAQSSYQPYDLTYQSFCETHISHGNNALSSIAETNSRGIDAFKYNYKPLHVLSLSSCNLIIPFSMHKLKALSIRANSLYRCMVVYKNGITVLKPNLEARGSLTQGGKISHR